MNDSFSCNFKAYCIFSLLNTVIYCIPAGWVWGEHGFLHNLGVVDIGKYFRIPMKYPELKSKSV